MSQFPASLQRLIREFSALPSVGEKSATRLAYYLVAQNQQLALSLAQSLKDAVDRVRLCTRCFFLSEEELCPLCRNSARDGSTICVVEKPMDVIAIERVGEFRGVYHVLHGLLAPRRGIGIDDIRVKELLARIDEGGVGEIILALGATVEGDATSYHLASLLSQRGIKATRLAQGMPKGGELEYTDEVTLSRAFSGRSIIGK